MKYAIACMVRMDTKAERDALFDIINTTAKPGIQKFEYDDSYLEKHKCYHDENPAKPCEVEEKIEAAAAPKP